MRLEPSALSEAVRRLVLDINQFESALETEEDLVNAALDPAQYGWFRDEGNPLVARSLQRNAVVLAQASFAFAANNGLTGSSSLGGGLGTVSQLVGQAAFNQDVDVRALVTLGVESVIDAVVEGPLSAIPFVGAAARVVWSMAKLIYDATNIEVTLPPLFRMSPKKDRDTAWLAISRVKGEHQSDDWTPLFLPHARGTWKMDEREGGVEFHRGTKEAYDSEIERLGCAPGDLFYVDGRAQSRIATGDVTIPNNARKPKYSNILGTGDNPAALKNLVFGLGAWQPSLAAFGRSVWSLAGTRSAAMFQIDAATVATEWAQFATATAYFRAEMDEQLNQRLSNLGKQHKREQIAVYLGNVGAALHTLRTRDEDGKLRELDQDELLAAALDPAKRAGADTVGKQAVKHANKLLKRQRQAASTPLNALVSVNAPALRNNKALRDYFLAERKELLAAGRFDGIVLEEVPDKSLRDELQQRSPSSMPLPTGFVDPASAERQRRFQAERRAELSKIDKPLEFGGYGAPPSAPEKGGGFGLALAGLVATAGLAAGGVALARRRR